MVSIASVPAAQGRGVLILGAHYTTLEWVGAAVSAVQPLDTIYRRQNNAAMEAWNSTFKAECGERFETNDEAEAKTFDYVEVFYNRQRRHSALGYVSPAEFERRFTEGQAA